MSVPIDETVQNNESEKESTNVWPLVALTILTFTIVGVSLLVTYNSGGIWLVVFQLVVLSVASVLVGRIHREGLDTDFLMQLCILSLAAVGVVVGSFAGEASGGFAGILTSFMAVFSVLCVVLGDTSACEREHNSHEIEWYDVVNSFTGCGVTIFITLFVTYLVYG